MSKIVAATQFTQVSQSDLTRYLELFGKDVVTKVNGQLDFGNFSSSLITVKFNTANAQVAVGHSLGRVPIGRLVYGQDNSGVIYDGTTANNASTIYLKCSATGSANIIVF